MEVPDWLARRAGAIQHGVSPETRFVLIDGEPLYMLEVLPVKGRFGCAVTNSANGRRLDDSAATYNSFDGALAGGLAQLCEWLGW